MGTFGCLTLILATILILLWKFSSVARYYIKFVSFMLFSAFAATTPIPIMLLNPRSSKNALIPAAGLRAYCKVLGLKLSVEGQENIIQNSGCVILINHQSILDLIVLAILWPIMDNCTVISKKEIFYLQPFGLASWLWGTIFINRVDKRGAQEAVNSTGRTIRERKARVLMFPEGTRNSKEKLLPFKKGAFHLAIASKCPIQPVAVNRYTFLGKQRFDNGQIHVKILPQISTENYDSENISELIETVRNVMQENVDIISKDGYLTEKIKQN